MTNFDLAIASMCIASNCISLFSILLARHVPRTVKCVCFIAIGLFQMWIVKWAISP